MSTKGSVRLLIVFLVWLGIAGLAAVTYRYLRSRAEVRAQAAQLQQYQALAEEARRLRLAVEELPGELDPVTIARKREELAARIEQARTIASTSSAPRRTDQPSLRLALDSFSGYCIFRTREFAAELSGLGLQLELVDDQADYARRLQDLQAGRTQLAVFTIDALVKQSAALSAMPATIVLLIDETRGADAMVAYKQAIPNLDALNRSDVGVVLTPDSPSEALLRAVQADFDLPALQPERWVAARDAADVYERFRKASPQAPQAFVLWEPFVSKVLEDDRAHVLVDSSKFKGVIVDVLVAERRFLRDQPHQVAAVMKAYLSTLFRQQARQNGMESLVQQDAAQFGQQLTPEQAERLVAGIWWKNTLENYGHLGLLSATDAQGLQPVESMIRGITSVLLKTGAIPRDPTGGQPHQLYYDTLLADLQRETFHPAVLGEGTERIRQEERLPELSAEAWASLLAVGTLRVDPVSFGRGNALLLEPGKAVLQNLISTLQTWPQYYLKVQGRARPEGDPEANRQLAMNRARAVEEYLREQGVPAARMRIEARVAAEGTAGQAQSVTFQLLQQAY